MRSLPLEFLERGCLLTPGRRLAGLQQGNEEQPEVDNLSTESAPQFCGVSRKRRGGGCPRHLRTSPARHRVGDG